jgi:hypothetical protein
MQRVWLAPVVVVQTLVGRPRLGALGAFACSSGVVVVSMLGSLQLPAVLHTQCTAAALSQHGADSSCSMLSVVFLLCAHARFLKLFTCMMGLGSLGHQAAGLLTHTL